MSQAAIAALDHWHDLLAQNISDLGWRCLFHYNRSKRETRNGIFLDDDSEFPIALNTALGHADVYCARPDVVSLVSSIAETVPWHPVLAGDELPSEIGFLHLTTPLTIADVHGKNMRIYAVQWYPSTVVLRSGEDTHTATVVAWAFTAVPATHSTTTTHPMPCTSSGGFVGRWR